MAKEFRLPNLGEGVEKGTVVAVLVSVGDRVAKDQPVLEIETEKAALEVPSDVSGVVRAIHVQKGDVVKVGQPLLALEEAEVPAALEADDRAQAAPPGPQQPPVQKASEPGPEPARAEKAGDSGPEPSPAQKVVGPGPQPSPAQKVVEPARARKEGNGRHTAPTWAARQAPGVEESRASVPAAPSVRRVARELGLDIREIQGTGPGGRISIEDVKAHARQILQSRLASGPAAAAAPSPLPDFTRFGEVEFEPLSSVRRLTAESMARSWTQVPHVTQHDKADITELEEWRKGYSARVEGGKLTVTAILIKVVAAALKVFPRFNSSLDLANQQIVLKKYCHIGVAVDTERGLLVPVVRHADRKGLGQIAAELGQLADKARTRKIGPDEMTGGCFTITNLGGIGGTSFTPIVNWPEVAILGVSRGTTEPVWRQGGFVPRLMLPLSLSYDHRVIDGADAARFLRWVCQALENPWQMLL